MINQEYGYKNSKHIYRVKHHPGHRAELIQLPNPEYDENAKSDEQPAWCQGRVGIACLNEGNMCQHLNYCGAERKVKRQFRKAMDKMWYGG